MNSAQRLLVLFFLIAQFSALPLSSQEKPEADMTIPRATLNRDYLTYTPNGRDVAAPKLIDGPDPGYTDAAREARVQGTVELKIVVDTSGKVKDVEVVRKLDPGLDKNAVKAVKKWRFQPGTKNGVPVNIQTSVVVEFRLTS